MKISKASNELFSALRENEREYYSDIVITLQNTPQMLSLTTKKPIVEHNIDRAANDKT